MRRCRYVVSEDAPLSYEIMNNRGVVYIAIGEQYLREATVSATSVAEYNQEVDICIITSGSAADEVRSDVFDRVIAIDDEELRRDIRDKVYNIRQAPYEKNLYLDTDTIVLGDISPVFESLGRFDITAAHAPYTTVTVDGVPDAFRELNTGVVGFVSNERTSTFFDDWTRIYDDQIESGRPGERVPIEGKSGLEDIGFGRLHDQASFREALFEGDVRFTALPREYNFRHSGRAHGEVKILHTSNKRRRERLEGLINDSVYGRTYVRNKERIYYDDGRTVRTEPRIERLVSRFGSAERAVVRSEIVTRVLKATNLFDVASRLYRRVR
jgi:hypothetical protein